MSVLAMILAAFGRASVGGGWLSRGYVYPVCAAVSAYVGFGLSWWALPFAAVAALTFWLGRTDWFNAPYMVARYGAAPASLASVYAYFEYGRSPGWYYPLLWGAGCLLTGWLDARIRVWCRYKSWTFRSYTLDSARIAEAVDGAVILGGFAFGAT